MKYLGIFVIILFTLGACTEYEDYTPFTTEIGDLAGEFIGNEDCGGSVYGPYSVFVFNKAGNSASSAWVENIYDSHYQVEVTVNGNSFNAQNAQVFDSNPASDTVQILPINGLFADVEGTLVSEDSINFSFILKDADGAEIDNCSFGAHRLTGFE